MQERPIPRAGLEFKLGSLLTARLTKLVKAGDVSGLKAEFAERRMPRDFQPLWDAFPEAVYIATSSDRLEMVQFLAHVGADVNFSCPIALAAWRGNASIAKVLVDHGAEVDKTVTEVNMTALLLAASRGNVDMVNLLLAAKASINMGDDKGRTALHFAAFIGHRFVVESLLRNGADAALKDHWGKDPWMYAGQNEHWAVSQALDIPITRIEKDPSPITDAKNDIKKSGQVTNQERVKLPERQRNQTAEEKAKKLNELKKFSKEFKVSAHITKDPIAVLAKDKAKKDKILEKNSQELSKPVVRLTPQPLSR